MDSFVVDICIVVQQLHSFYFFSGSIYAYAKVWYMSISFSTGLNDAKWRRY